MAKGGDILEKRAKLSDTKQGFLEQLLRGRTGAPPQRPTIPRRPRHTFAALSFAQQRLWFLNKMEPESAAYNVPYALRLTGQLNVPVMERSLREIISRHEVLRTTFPLHDGEPVQVIAESLDWSLQVIDLTTFTEPTREAEADRLMYEESCRPFDLGGTPSFRATLLRLKEGLHILLINFHHIICDEWSLDVLEKELLTLYECFASNKPCLLSELPIQFADFAVWQRQWMQGEVLNKQLSYWAKKLANAPTLLELPTDRPRPPIQTFHGAGISRVLTGPLCQSLKRISQKNDATLFMTLLAAFKILLFRYTGQEDVLVGTPIANRNHIETEGLIGFFLNTLVLRTNLSGDRSFLEILSGVRDVALQAYENQDLPFDKLVEKLQPERRLNHNPIFQVLFVLLSANRESKQFSGLTMTHVPIKDETSKFDLALFTSETSLGLRVSFQYNINLFAQPSIARMLGHFQALLEAIATDPTQRVSDLSLLSAAERNQLIRDWNQTGTEIRQNLSLHQLFEAQAMRTPDAVAVTFESQQMTYRHLNQRANQLAHFLQKLGVGPETMVGICVERSLEMVIGILGVLKAGGAYVPLDYEYPKERLGFMLHDSRSAILLTQERLKGAVPASQARVICLDHLHPPAGVADEQNLSTSLNGDNLAYCIYTSGSTGKPKGVLISHRAISNHLLWRQKTFPLSEQDAFLQKASLSFDISVWEIFAPLISGARLVLARPGGQKDSGYLVRLIAEEKITIAHFGPAMLQIFLEEPNLGDCQHLRRVFCGGDPLPVELQSRFFGQLSAELCNQYGPTETTVDATFHACENNKKHAQTIPIGRPIANTQAFILDSNFEPVPIGITGELCLGGRSLARGYLNASDLTAEKFIPNSFGLEPGSRLYRTGDLARYSSDGEIEFRGRLDYQVKIRGFRIELGEIEAELAAHPRIRGCVVTQCENTLGEKEVVAYFVSNSQPTPSIHDLRSFLKEKLPQHMIPSTFVLLDALPLTPNGKLDRRRLPRPEWNATQSNEPIVSPKTPIEEVLATIWTQILGKEKVSIHEDFFGAGGHSLLAIQLFSKLRSAFQIDLPVRLLFEAPTIAGLARLIEQEFHKTTSPVQPLGAPWVFLTPIQSLGPKRPFYLLPGGLGSEEEFLVYARMARFLGFDQPFYGLRARSADNEERPHSSVAEMAAAYIGEIRVLQPNGPYLLVGECIGGIIAFEMARQLMDAGQTVGLLALLDSWCPRRSEYFYHTIRKFQILLRKNFFIRAFYHLSRFPKVESAQRRAYLHEKAAKARNRFLSALRRRPKDRRGVNRPEIPLRDPLFDAYYQTLIRYRPKTYRGKITLLVNQRGYEPCPSRGWDKYAGGGLEIHQVPGDHVSYIRQHVQSAAAELKQCLEKAQG